MLADQKSVAAETGKAPAEIPDDPANERFAGRAGEAAGDAGNIGKGRAGPFPPPPACATWRCWRRFIPAACASASCAACARRTLTGASGSCACAARAKRSGWCPLANRRWKAIQNYWAVLKQPPSGPSPVFLRGDQKSRAAQAAATVPAPEAIPGHCRTRSGPDAAQAAAQLRHAPAGCGRGSAECAGTAWPRPPGHHADLHARDHRALEKSLRRGASPGVSASVSD